MTPLSDAAVRHLRETLERPDGGGRYEVFEPLGRGGMGTVYRALDRGLEREVALKVLSLPADGAAFAARLTREARVLAQLEHPGIVGVHDLGVLPDGRPFYIMRLIRGMTLLEAAGRLTRGDALRIFLRICDAVSYAHAQGVIHRDLSPRNVMVGEFGEALVLDWGVARVLAYEGGDAAEVVGTPGFMAPEQAAGGAAAADARSDVFGLGAILRELLGGREPVSPPLQAIVARATAPSPDARYPSVEQLAADVRRWLDAEPVEAYREGPVERAARVYRRNRPLILLLLAYVVVRVVILVWRGV